MRRARIKALAAVPLRKKPVQDITVSTHTSNVSNEEQEKEDICGNDKKDIATKLVSELKEQREENISRTKDKTDIATKHVSDIKEQKDEDISSIDTREQGVTKDVSKKQKEKNVPSTDISEQDAIKRVTEVQKEAIKNEQDKINLAELKPVVVENSNSGESCSPVKPYSQQTYIQTKSSSQEVRSPMKQHVRQLCIQAKPNFQEPCAQVKSNFQELCPRVKPHSQQSYVQAKPNFHEQCVQINNQSREITDQSVQKNVLPNVPMGIDIVSPTKTQNRTCFMRPTPRLDSGGRVRKNSVQGSGASASESEDEHGKRAASVVSNRIRNDSICSVQSNKESTINDSQNNSPQIKTTQKRRMPISESARRFAEARREFLLKHENRTPDRSQLKMYDLIYYDPGTKPMPGAKSSIERKKPKRKVSPQLEEVPEVENEEEKEDDPSSEPAPRVKVGPDGQLIIDEQSLVIEQTDAKRNREILESEPIIEDDSCRGFYKKHKRSKDWPKWETFKFYRVLNVVGTDFLLMQTLFPNRTRQEIKQKYKKEERVNRQLVEKALKYHQEFNTERLGEQLALLQKLENIQEAPKKTSEKLKSEQQTKIARRRRHRLVANSIGECEELSVNNQETENAVVNDEIDTEINNEASTIQNQQIKKGSKARKMKRRLDDEFDEFDENSSYASHNADSDSSPEVYRPRPTRSGRLPRKVNKLQAPHINVTFDSGDEDGSPVKNDTAEISSHVAMEVTEIINTPAEDNVNGEMSCPKNITNVIPDINQMKPGSLVIVTKESTEDPGKTILQVYMVSSNIDSANTTVVSDGMPVNSSSTSSTVTTNLEDAEPIDVADDREK